MIVFIIGNDFSSLSALKNIQVFLLSCLKNYFFPCQSKGKNNFRQIKEKLQTQKKFLPQDFYKQFKPKEDMVGVVYRLAWKPVELQEGVQFPPFARLK